MYFLGSNTFSEPWHLPHSPSEQVAEIVYAYCLWLYWLWCKLVEEGWVMGQNILESKWVNFGTG